jgi:DNA repair protein RecO (recombination protein O)
MLAKTGGIVLSYIKYRETSIIAKIFTEQFGMQTYLVNSVRSLNSKPRIAYFQPLTLLEMVVYYHRGKEINRISELRCSYNFHTLPFDIRKTTVALFITEILSQVLKEEEEPFELFHFLHQAIKGYDEQTENFMDFHVLFLVQLTGFLGIRPDSGAFILKETGRSSESYKHLAILLDELIQSNTSPVPPFDRPSRNSLIQILVDYYRSHYDSIKPIKSIQVLNEVFR